MKPMKIPRLALALLTAVLLPASVFAAKKPLKPYMVPVSDAALDALTAVINTSKHRQAELTDRAAVLEKQIAAITAKAKNPKADLGEQLSKEDLDALNLLTTQDRYLKQAATIEAVRQSNILIVKDLYRASYFTATMMTEYVGEKGALDDDFDDYCQAKAKLYGMEIPVDLLVGLQDYIVDNTSSSKKEK
jgi:hypothetical protein